jgi:hypothetical protein
MSYPIWQESIRQIAFGPINFPPSQRHPNSKSRVKALRISDNFWKSIRRVAALERRLTAAAANHTTNQWFLQLVQVGKYIHTFIN